MKELPDIVILANGAFPTHPVPLSILNRAKHVIACDGAVSHYPQADIVIGDGDSVPDVCRGKFIQIDEQEDNDLTKATLYCMRKGWQRIAYLGCTGLREDHTLGNIALLMRYYREMGISGTMFTDHGFFTPSQGDRTFQSLSGQQVSIFNFGSTRIQSERLKWNSYAYKEWWQGTLNESFAEQFTIHADSYYLVYQTYEAK
ncbi:MAG: thiamine diphosphokinase [Prevotella sp.]|nr:thiamine diphosphokinase [Prevotella sp.]